MQNISEKDIWYSYGNKTLWERILGRRCIKNIGMYISWESGFDDRE